MPSTPIYYRADQLATQGYTPATDTWTTLSTHQNVRGPWDDVLDQQRNPLWRDQIKAHKDASTHYRRSGTSFTVLPLLGEARGYGTYPFSGKGYFANAMLNLHPPFGVFDETTRDQALARVKRKIASLEQGYQALIPLAELREARSLFRQMIDYTTDLIEAVANLKRTRGKSLFRYVQDRWLIYSFGISPMIRDLNDLGQSMWTFLTKGDVRDLVWGKMTKTWTNTSSGSEITGFDVWAIGFNARAEHRLSYRYVGAWEFLIRSSNDYGAMSHFGLKIPALIPALWETTIYSWVADYFSTMGDWLEDVFVGQAGNSIYMVECRKYQYSSILNQFHYKSIPSAQSNLIKHRQGQVKLDYWEFERTPLNALPSRILRWKTVDEIGKHALTKLLNLAALTFRGGKPKQDLLTPRYRIEP